MPKPSPPVLTVSDIYGDVAVVSCVWVIFAYFLMPMGPTAAMSGCSAGQIKWGQRVFMNLQEQAVLFFVPLWMYAVFISADEAAWLGWLYLGFRSLYPSLWMVIGGEGGPPFPQLFLSTFPAYGINLYEAVVIFAKLGCGFDIKTFFGSTFRGLAATTFLYLLFCIGITPVLHKKVYSHFFVAPNKGA